MWCDEGRNDVPEDPESTAPQWLGVALICLIGLVAWGAIWLATH